MFRKLTTWILIAAVAGVVVGWIGHNNTVDAAAATRLAGYFSILSDVFLRLIKVIIAPLVFATVVSGIAGMGDAKAVGRGTANEAAVHEIVARQGVRVGIVATNNLAQAFELLASGRLDAVGGRRLLRR